ncbi:MAG: UDP-N-acetylmuramoyl-tripeptide--D-alanyl-D-alanine ligase [Deltaproteobacteria bacterium]|jgi:UDP-N-acetylmuramoyl-tripeptide--D-alanyl-D-alanine ligase|nr:UDP-N-acetylmuramoyl-tripeptide--D-alanyl-D-alanine ligase [Deltaproteobacteria bacterium]
MFTLREMAALLGGREHLLPEDLADQRPTRAVLDSREAGEKALFICLKGARADGHDFARQAAAQGALGIVAEKNPFAGQRTPPLAVLLVQDSALALQKLGAAWREGFKGKVMGITGSAGKTSVKEALASVLAVRGLTARNPLNLNNRLGLPLSMLNAPAEANFWVMEAGISEKGDMDELGGLLRPDLALVLNVGAAHLEGLGGELGVARQKAALLRYLRPDGFALVSADYPDLLRESRAIRKDDLCLFSTRRDDAPYRAAYLGPASLNTGRYLARAAGESFELTAPFRGDYGSENVAAVAGAAHLLGLDAGDIRAGLAQAAPPQQRFNCVRRGGITLIDDSYNANPLSTARMLRTAAEMAAETGGPLVLVLGEMLELGAYAAEAHYTLGRDIAASGAALFFWKGGQVEPLREGLRAGAFQGAFAALRDKEDFAAALPDLRAVFEGGRTGEPKGAILFKGSRGNRLEQLAEEFNRNYFLALSA